MEKVKTPLPENHSAIVFDFSEERNSRKKKKALAGDYKQDFPKFREFLQNATAKDEIK